MVKFWGFLVVAVGIVFGTVCMLEEKPKDNNADVDTVDQRKDEMYRAWKHAKAGEQIEVVIAFDVVPTEKVNVYLFTGKDKKFITALSGTRTTYNFSVHPILSSLTRPPYTDAKIIAERDGKEVKITHWTFVHTNQKN